MRIYTNLLKDGNSWKSGAYNLYKSSALTSTCNQCAEVGLKIFSEGGSAVDCAIATLLCAGVKNPARLGVGGGFVASIYSKQQKSVKVLLARERAPADATPGMFKDAKEALFGGKAAAVPGSLKGYWEMHQKYGKLSWRRLFEPALKMCREGIYVEPFTFYGIQQVEQETYKTKTLKDILVDPFSGKSKLEKRKIYRTDLARTLEIISFKSPDVLYKGELTANFVKDIQNAGGIITELDMNNYDTRWLEPLKVYLPELKCNVFAPPPPSSGAIMLFVLKMLSMYCPLKGFNDLEQWHRIIEALKFAYGYRSRLGDPEHNSEISKIVSDMLADNNLEEISKKLRTKTSNDFKDYGGDFLQKNDVGTYHFNFISPEGDAICITETINTLFGALFRSASTGIILNNTMNDFSLPANVFKVPPTQANLIAPRKVPLSSMLPTIVTNRDNSEVKLLAGGAGGTKIISAVSQVLVHHLLLGVDLETAVDKPRLHHQLMPMNLEYESNFPEEILHALWLRGHNLQRMKRLAVVSVISKFAPGGLHAKGDLRRHGANAGV